MEDILSYINNYFAVTKEEGTFKIEDNSIKIKGNYLQGQYIKLEGSFFNDGIYRVESLVDKTITLIGANNEEFKGVIYSLAIPKDLISIAKKLEELKEKNTNGIYESESFGEYSYTLAKNSKGEIYSNIDSFKNELKKYRKMKDTSLTRARVI